MPQLRRSQAPPAVSDVQLDPGERRLAWALTAGGAAVVATDQGLHLPGQPRIGWPDIERVSWKTPVMLVQGIGEVERGGPCWEVQLPDPRNLPEVVRSRVVESIGWSEHRRLSPSGGVRLVGRRRPGQELLHWQLVYDQDTGSPDAQQRAQAEAFLLDARRTIG